MDSLSETQSAELMELISGVNRRYEQAMEARLKPTGLPIEQYRILEALHRKDGLSMGELAIEVFVDSPTLTKIIDRMITGADVYRAPDPNDRRKVLIFLSDKGRATLTDVRTVVQGSHAGMIKQLGAGEIGQLRTMLESMLRID
ncbi:MarR family transcriptional regulator [Rhizobium sp. 2MFCol3.1]|uniref:MarR family winged helix-turn-helix transcriptional regulator n=1 Tax=Rhizobium sp. 2MFCol3.1 TaxID=1246459 RepID=UPI00036DCE12|nr:MarR family transcriptional regulator [Rhizobium sp. 2MFCol3.1]